MNSTVVLAASLLALATAAQAENCRIALSCDGAGTCVSDDRAISIVLRAISINADGIGTFEITLDDTTVVAKRSEMHGPLMWSDIKEYRHTLISSGPANLLWHSVSAVDKGTSKVRFLTCVGLVTGHLY